MIPFGFLFPSSYQQPCPCPKVNGISMHFLSFPPSCGPFLIISTTYERPPWTPSARDTNEARLRRRARNFTSAQVMITISYLDLPQGAEWFLPFGFNLHLLEDAGRLVTSALSVVPPAFPVVHIWRIGRSNRRVYAFGLLTSSRIPWIPRWKPTSSMSWHVPMWGLKVWMVIYKDSSLSQCHKQLCLKLCSPTWVI